jgi:hypothetical protein
VSEALDRLLTVEIASRISSRVSEPDAYRRAYCYTRETSEALRSHETSLRAIFGGLCSSARTLKILPLEGWMSFVHSAALIGADVSDRDAILCFASSRMAVHDPMSTRGKARYVCLPFEGFLEALCRLAAIKALPTKDEIAERGDADAGAFLLALRDTHSSKYQAFLKDEHTHVEWGGVPTGEPIHMRLVHMLHLIIRTIEGSIGRKSNLVISEAERCARGRARSSSRGSSQNEAPIPSAFNGVARWLIGHQTGHFAASVCI